MDDAGISLSAGLMCDWRELATAAVRSAQKSEDFCKAMLDESGG